MIFYSYVSLPEGNSKNIRMYPKKNWRTLTWHCTIPQSQNVSMWTGMSITVVNDPYQPLISLLHKAIKMAKSQPLKPTQEIIQVGLYEAGSILLRCVFPCKFGRTLSFSNPYAFGFGMTHDAEMFKRYLSRYFCHKFAAIQWGWLASFTFILGFPVSSSGPWAKMQRSA